MTAIELQDNLAGEVSRLFRDRKFLNASGKRVPLNVFVQNLPVEFSDEDADPVPYLEVVINGGEDEGAKDSFNVVHLSLVCCLFDDTRQAQGHRDLMGVIQNIYRRFHEDPRLGDSFYQGGFEWVIQDESYYPYYIGAMKMDFVIPAVRRVSPYA